MALETPIASELPTARRETLDRRHRALDLLRNRSQTGFIVDELLTCTSASLHPLVAKNADVRLGEEILRVKPERQVPAGCDITRPVHLLQNSSSRW